MVSPSKRRFPLRPSHATEQPRSIWGEFIGTTFDRYLVFSLLSYLFTFIKVLNVYAGLISYSCLIKSINSIRYYILLIESVAMKYLEPNSCK